MEKLKIDDRFKSWMRRRLSDPEYAEKIMHKLTGLTDATMLKVWAHAALPIQKRDDPEAMIGLIKGHDCGNNRDFLLAIFGEWESFRDIAHGYIYHLWDLYSPVNVRDFEYVPQIYEAAFVDSESEDEIIPRRWKVEEENDGKVTSVSEFEDFRINLINTKMDSEIIKAIMGKDRGENEEV